jgi:hypothetical protein
MRHARAVLAPSELPCQDRHHDMQLLLPAAADDVRARGVQLRQARLAEEASTRRRTTEEMAARDLKRIQDELAAERAGAAGGNSA